MASIKYNNVYINDHLSIIGPEESDSKLKKVELKMNDFYFGESTFEAAEVKMQRVVMEHLLNKNDLKSGDINICLGGDLLNQISASNYANLNSNIPFLGLYSACATFVESILVGSMFLQSSTIKKVMTICSSHNKTAERQYRYPIEYGMPKKNTSTYTATCAIGTIIGNNSSNIKVESATIGSITEMGITDVNNMGAIMAPAAAKTLNDHLNDLKRDVSYYDLIMTGDLGCIGMDIFKQLTLRKYNIKLKKYLDAGCELYLNSQDVNAGASGPTALPLILFNKVLLNKKYKKILIIGTGSLHSTTFINQQKVVPAIAHAISLEVL